MIQTFLWASPCDGATIQTPSPQRTTMEKTPMRNRAGLSIRRHPHDLRRTVICGRFAEVCAALESLAAAEPDTLAHLA